MASDWIQLAGVVVAAGSVMWSIRSYLRTRTDTVDRELRVARRELEKPFLERQLALYFEATGATAILASGPSGDEWRQARVRFWALYWGQLSIVESKEVEACMVKFGLALETFEIQHPDGEFPPDTDRSALKDASYELAHAVRRSVRDNWEVSYLPDLQGGRA